MKTVAKGGRPNNLVGMLAAAALPTGCPTDPVPLPSSGCVQGTQITCGCPGGASSVQVCQADRTYGACQCGGDAGGMDAADAGDAAVAPDTGGPAIDAGVIDADATDTGSPLVDTGVPATDTGSPAPDVGGPDTGAPDVGTPDVGPPVDAGSGADVLPAGCAATTPGNCCGVACPSAANASPVCGGGACTVACMPGYASCDGTLANGCEVTLATTTAHCGACGAACAAGRVCVAGACVLCPSGQTACAGACVDTRTNAAHCGACGSACAGGQECNAGGCRTACVWGESEFCTHTAGGVPPTCCAAGRTCGSVGGMLFGDRCGGGLGAACTQHSGCLRSAGGNCEGGRCCFGNRSSCTSDAQCCSGRCSPDSFNRVCIP